MLLNPISGVKNLIFGAKKPFLGGKFFFAAFLEIMTSYLGYSTSFLTLERVFNYIMLLNPISGAKNPVFGIPWTKDVIFSVLDQFSDLKKGF